MRRDGKDDSDAAVGDTLAPAELPTIGSQIDTARRGDLVRSPVRLVATDPARYSIADEIGRGGLGRIMRARDHHLGRHVAIKELLHAHEELVARFAREALVTARLMHPAIVPVYDAGTWPSGLPFYAMKMVSGRSFDEVIKGAATLRERLALLPNVIAVAEAIAYAHSEGIIHRDLKPANVLVGSFGETVVIDWGLAKDLRSAEEPVLVEIARGTETIAGAVMGTPSYMPPEQALGEPVDERADVYALGALLYHVLSGVPPYVGPTADTVLELVIKAPPKPLPSLAADVPAELATIVAKAMARDPAARYPTAAELAEDLKRFQTGGLVSSHLYTARALVRRWIARHRGVVAMAAIAGVLLAGGGAYAFHRILEERAVAEDNARTATQRADQFAIAQARAMLDKDPSQSITALASLSPGAPWDTVRRIATEARTRGIAMRELVLGEDAAVAGFLPGDDVLVFDQTGIYRWNAQTGAASKLAAMPSSMWSAELSPDGALLGVRIHPGNVTDRHDEGVQLIETATGVLRPFVSASRLEAFAFTPDGKQLLVVGDQLSIVTLATGARRDVSAASTLIHHGARLAVSRDSAMLLIATTGDIARCDLATAVCTVLPDAQPDSGNFTTGMPIAISAAGTHAVFGGQFRTGTIDLATNEVIDHTEIQGTLGNLVYAPNGLSLVATTQDVDGVMYVWDAQRAHSMTWRPGTSFTSLEVSNDRAVAGTNSYVAVAMFGDGKRLALRGQHDAVTSVAVRGDTVASASADGSVRLWKVPHAALPCDLPTVWRIAISADRRLAIDVSGQGLAVCDVAVDRAKLVATSSSVADWYTAAISPDDKRIAIVSENKLVVVELATGQTQILAERPFASVAWPRDGLLAWSSLGVDTWSDDLATHRRPLVYDQPHLLHLAPDGRHLVAVEMTDHGSGPPALIDLATNRTTPLPGLSAFTFSPTGDRVAAATPTGELRIVDIATAAIRNFDGEVGRVLDLKWSPDATQIASFGEDTLRLWTVATGASRVALRATGKRGVRTLSFSSDGTRIAALTADGTTYLIDTATLENTILGKLETSPSSVLFWPDGKAIVTGNFKTAATWRDDLPTEPGALRAWLAAAVMKSIAAR